MNLVGIFLVQWCPEWSDSLEPDEDKICESKIQICLKVAKNTLQKQCEKFA